MSVAFFPPLYCVSHVRFRFTTRVELSRCVFVFCVSLSSIVSFFHPLRFVLRCRSLPVVPFAPYDELQRQGRIFSATQFYFLSLCPALPLFPPLGRRYLAKPTNPKLRLLSQAPCSPNCPALFPSPFHKRCIGDGVCVYPPLPPTSFASGGVVSEFFFFEVSGFWPDPGVSNSFKVFFPNFSLPRDVFGFPFPPRSRSVFRLLPPPSLFPFALFPPPRHPFPTAPSLPPFEQLHFPPAFWNLFCPRPPFFSLDP